jgi:hypothetical protein
MNVFLLTNALFCVCILQYFLRGLPHLWKGMCRSRISKKVAITPGYEPDLDAITNLCPVPPNVNDAAEVAAIFDCTMKGGPRARMPICPDAAVLASIAKLSKPASEQGKKRDRSEEQEPDVEETQACKSAAGMSSFAPSRCIAVSEPSSECIPGNTDSNSACGAMISSPGAHPSGASTKKKVEGTNTTNAAVTPSTLQSLDTGYFAMRDRLALQLHEQDLDYTSRRHFFSRTSHNQSTTEDYIMQLHHRQEQAVAF